MIDANSLAQLLTELGLEVTKTSTTRGNQGKTAVRALADALEKHHADTCTPGFGRYS